jgi:hypothetical protein
MGSSGVFCDLAVSSLWAFPSLGGRCCVLLLPAAIFVGVDDSAAVCAGK